MNIFIHISIWNLNDPSFDWSSGILLEGFFAREIADIHRFQVNLKSKKSPGTYLTLGLVEVVFYFPPLDLSPNLGNIFWNFLPTIFKSNRYQNQRISYRYIYREIYIYVDIYRYIDIFCLRIYLFLKQDRWPCQC